MPLSFVHTNKNGISLRGLRGFGKGDRLTMGSIGKRRGGLMISAMLPILIGVIAMVAGYAVMANLWNIF